MNLFHLNGQAEEVLKLGIIHVNANECTCQMLALVNKFDFCTMIS